MVDVGDGEIESTVDLALLHGKKPSRAVRNCLERDPFDGWLRSRVVVAGFEDDTICRNEFNKLVGASPKRESLGRSDVLVRELFFLEHKTPYGRA